jgi:competence protein ComEA
VSVVSDDAAVPEARPLAPETTSETAGRLVVHVAGPVADPGLVVLPEESRVADAVAAAGGALPSADLSLLNLAAPVVDGQQVIVPRTGGPAPSPAAAGPAGPDGAKIDLNQAGVAELEELPGVGPVLAERIVAHREANGPFGSLEDLLDVPGIGEGRLATLRDAAVVP